MPELKKCPQCGDTVEFEIDFSLFDGSGKTVKKIVPKRCFCSLKKEEELKRQMELYNRQREVERLRNLSLIDAKAQNVTFASCEKTDGNERALKIARRYVEKFNDLKSSGQGIMFYGDVGTGKSYIAAAIANELMAELHTVVMTSFPNILERALDFDSNSLDFASRAELLVIDDLGAERSTDFALEQMYKVIDDRYLQWDAEDHEYAKYKLCQIVEQALQEELKVADEDQRSEFLSVSGLSPLDYREIMTAVHLSRRDGTVPMAVLSQSEIERRMNAVKRA